VSNGSREVNAAIAVIELSGQACFALKFLADPE